MAVDSHDNPPVLEREDFTEQQAAGVAALINLAEPPQSLAPARHRKRRKELTVTVPLPRLRHVAQACAIAVTVAIAAVTSLYLVDRPAPAATGAARPYVWPHGAPIGITLSGLQDYIMTPAVIATMERQARAARYFWHANTIRYQILQDRLVGADGTRYSPYYMRDIRAVTNYTLHLGMTVVLNAQTEQST